VPSSILKPLQPGVTKMEQETLQRLAGVRTGVWKKGDAVVYTRRSIPGPLRATILQVGKEEKEARHCSPLLATCCTTN
jgi:hypothetical protein